jgi:hypothetical protein
MTKATRRQIKIHFPRPLVGEGLGERADALVIRHRRHVG